jgi:hypothetical protein
MRGNQADVVFDYEGALSLARRVYSLAVEVANVAQVRGDLAGSAAVGFSGVCAQQFFARTSVEAATCDRFSKGLQMDAMAVAQMWKAAMEEENRRLYARHVDQVKSRRSTLQEIGDALFGFHYPPEPGPVPLPQPPTFAPTAELVRYR